MLPFLPQMTTGMCHHKRRQTVAPCLKVQKLSFAFCVCRRKWMLRYCWNHKGILSSLNSSDRLWKKGCNMITLLPLLPICFLFSLRCAGFLDTAVQRAGLFVLFIFILAILVFLASGNSGSFTWLMLQPFCQVHYASLPPI